MALANFAMIIIGPGYNPDIHRSTISFDQFSTSIICESPVEQAFGCAQELLQSGTQLIELCGGFTPEIASAIEASLQRRIPVGVIQYTPAQILCLQTIFS